MLRQPAGPGHQTGNEPLGRVNLRILREIDLRSLTSGQTLFPIPLIGFNTN